MSFSNPDFTTPRRSVAGREGEWVKMFDPPRDSPPTPENLTPNNPVPEFMLANGFQDSVRTPNTVQRRLMHNLGLTMFDGKVLNFFVFSDSDNSATSGGTFPAATIRVPRGVIFHAESQGAGPPPHTIHWHGIEPTPMNDGVGHCSMEIGQYTYQLQPNFIGTYFYHCHRNTVQHFEFGLYGLFIVEPPDAYSGPNAGGFPRRTAANLTRFPQFPGFVGGELTSGDPHAMTVPYDVEAFWVLDDRDSVWSDLASGAEDTFPIHGDQPGVNDVFDRNPGVNGFFAFNDYNPDYFFVTGVNVPAPVGGIGDVPAGITIPPALNSGVTGTQVSVNARVGQTVLIRCVNGAYMSTRITFPVDIVIIAFDGRALGVPPFGNYNSPFVLRAGTPIDISTARRFDALIRADRVMNDFATAEFIQTRGGQKVFTARIPIVITP